MFTPHPHLPATSSPRPWRHAVALAAGLLLVLLGVAPTAAAGATPRPAAVGPVGLSLAVYANDADPTSPTGSTADGADSTSDSAPLPVPAVTDVRLSFVVENTGGEPIERLIIGGANSDDVLVDETLAEPLAPGGRHVSTATLPHAMFDAAVDAGDVYERTYAATGLVGIPGEDGAQQASASDAIRLVLAAGTPTASAEPAEATAAAEVPSPTPTAEALSQTGIDGAGLLMGIAAAALLLAAGGVTVVAHRRVRHDRTH